MKTLDTHDLPGNIDALKTLFLEQQSHWLANLLSSQNYIKKTQSDLQFSQNDLQTSKNDLQISKNDLQALQNDLQTSRNNLQTLQNDLQLSKNEQARLLEQLEYYQAAFLLLQKKRFGKSSEKDAHQGELFDEVEQEAEETVIESTEAESQANLTPKKAPSEKRKKPGRKPLPAHLHREIREYDLSDAEKHCKCGCLKQFISESVSEQLEVEPAKIRVIQHRRKKYACTQCEGQIKIAPMPPQPIPKSNASPGLLAYVAVAKYQDALPLYRQEAIFKRLGIHLPRNTLANWMIKGSELLQPLYNLLQDRLLSSGYVQMDETPVQVLSEPGREASTKSYMWVRKTGDPEQSVILFDYFPSRAGAVIETLLPDYQGFLQTDDYGGYHRKGEQPGVHHLGCMAHARRKFVDAEKIADIPKGKLGKAGMGVQLIKKLYAIEQRIKDKTPEEKYQTRQQESRPHLDKIRAWLDDSLPTVVPKSPLGKALAYLHKNWSKLILYLEDGRLNIDNNLTENAIRPFVTGRKNWLFSQSPKGARSSAMLYSMIETAKANGLEPYAYLKILFEKLPAAQNLEDFEQLLPWTVQIPGGTA